MTTTIAEALADYLTNNLSTANVEVVTFNFDLDRRFQGYSLTGTNTAAIIVDRGALSFVPVDRTLRTVLWQTELMIYAADDGAVEDLIYDIATTIDAWEQAGGGAWAAGARYFYHCETMAVNNTFQNGAVMSLSFVRPMESR